MVAMVLDHVQLAIPAGSEGRAREFYSGVLQLREIPKPESMLASGGVWYRLGNGELHLGIETDFRPARKAHPALRVDDIDELSRRCVESGLELQWDERYPGVRRFYVADPFGNRIEILQPD